MHPYLTNALAEARMEDLRRDAARHRLVAQAQAARAARASRRGHGGGVWRTPVERATATVRRFAELAHGVARAPQPTCCPG